ncbi:MAG: hypothetical protein IKZ46_03700 [Victivallales bacterium]|nr:hypothetical protein [Victivallales bacterium]
MKIAEKKNVAKYRLYSLAYGMIKDSIDCNCPLQAVAIEESILTDRLSSTLNVGRQKATPKDSLGRALREWKPKKSSDSRNRNAALFDSEMNELFPRLEAWWEERCFLLHGLVKSPQGGCQDVAPEDFVARAVKAAKVGLLLTRKVDNWTKRQIQKARTAPKNEGSNA